MAQVDIIHSMWAKGYDTYKIAYFLSLPEHVVYNALANRKKEATE